MYTPHVGRWISEDPSGFVDGPNVYLYVANNPTGNVDPSGTEAEEVGLNEKKPPRPIKCGRRTSGPFDWAPGGDVSTVDPIKGAFFSCLNVYSHPFLPTCRQILAAPNIEGNTVSEKLKSMCDSLYRGKKVKGNEENSGILEDWKKMSFAAAATECSLAIKFVPGGWNTPCPCDCPDRKRTLFLNYEIIEDIQTPAGKFAACFRTCNARVVCTGQKDCEPNPDTEKSDTSSC